MGKRRQQSGSWRPRSTYISSDPEKRARSLANLKLRHGRAKPLAGGPATVKVGPKAPNKFQDDPLGFIEQHFYVRETRKPMQLLPFQREALTSILKAEPRTSLAVIGQPKKTGKSTLCAALALWYLLNTDMPEIYLLASDIEQTKLVCFDKLVKAVRMHPTLRDCCKVTADRVEFEDGFVQVLAPNATIGGLNPSLVIAEELWAWKSAEHRRAWDELCNTPTRQDNLVLVTSYAGYAEDMDSILHELYRRGVDIQDGKAEADPGFFFAWHGLDLYEQIPWVKPGYLQQQRRRMRPAAFCRMFENRWVSGEEAFIDAELLDCCVDPSHRRGLRVSGPVVVGVDAAVKHDAAAVVMIGQLEDGRLAVLDHGMFRAPKVGTIDLEETVESLLRLYAHEFQLHRVVFDPYQMARSAAVLKRAGLPMREFIQSVPNLVAAAGALHGLLSTGRLVLYPHDDLRQHLLNAKTKQHPQGWRLTKARSGDLIDLAAAMSFAALEAQQLYLLKTEPSITWIDIDEDSDDDDGPWEEWTGGVPARSQAWF